MTYEIPPTNFAQMIAPYPQQMQEIAKALQLVIADVLPQLEENVSGGKKVANALYSFEHPNQVVCGIQLGETACKLFIHQFEQVSGMGFNIQGSGKHARHIKFASQEQVKKDLLAPLLSKVWESADFK